jgi:hypothetical protein
MPTPPTETAPAPERPGSFAGGEDRSSRWTRTSPYTRPGSRLPQYQPRSSYLTERSGPVGAASPRPTPYTIQTAVRKPFADYQSSPAVSPYLNLFRNDTNNGTVDNYNTLVRPFVQQNYMNQTFTGQIDRLQNRTYLQGSALRQLDRQTQGLEGYATPQYYQNYQGFFPNPYQQD